MDVFDSSRQTGREFWRLISEPNTVLRVLHRIGRMPAEFRYHFKERPSGYELNMCGILGYTLPGLDGDPGALFSKLAKVVPGFPTQEPRDHCFKLFDLLARLSGKGKWVERSGASAFFAADLVDSFSGMPIVYLDRDCVDTAVSVSRSPILVLFQIGLLIAEDIGINPYASNFDCGYQNTPPRIVQLLPECITAEIFDSFIGAPATMKRAILYLARMHHISEAVLEHVPAGILLRVRYEDLVRAPEDCLRRVGEFLGISDCGEWVDEMTPRVNLRPPGIPLDDRQRGELYELFNMLISDPSMLGRGRIGEVMDRVRRYGTQTALQYATLERRGDGRKHARD
ncbi:sulfotransferase [Streptomyces sp. NPDC020681]|uniref:sulfotransferase n=1 Tax=Streptomyces sp. NPDC020681 TaxID=3365083 RepID=UPI0037B03604